MGSGRTLIALGAAGALVVGVAACGKSAPSGGSPTRGSTATNVSLTITSNAIVGGKNDQEAKWTTNYVIPKFTAMEKSKGVTADVKFQASGVDDGQFKSKVSLDFKSGGGADILSLDGINVGEFAQAQYLKPLSDIVGAKADTWDGWKQIPAAVQGNTSFEGKRYGIPSGTDGRVLYYNKKLFAQAGLPTDWQPKSWQDILSAGQALKKISGVAPLQINAGSAMGEATTTQGVLPLLAGTGHNIYENGKWQGDTGPIRDVLQFYRNLYGGGLGEKNYQEAAKGRDESFAAFAAGKVGVLLEGDYLWRSVINPSGGTAPMKTRDADVGYALIPAKQAGAGVRGQDFVSISGGSGYFLNPNTKYPQQAWDLLTFMSSADAVKALVGDNPRITARKDVNDRVLTRDPLLTFISTKVLPITVYRPGLAAYPEVSAALQQATADIISGQSVDSAVKTYQRAVEKAVGADHVTNS